MMKIKQFEIWVADLNPRMGTEAGKIRPVMVVQTDLLNDQHPSTVVCPITTNIKPDTEILRVHLGKFKFGLKEDGGLMIDQIRTIDKRRLVKKLGAADNDTAEKIRENLKILLDLE